MLHDLVFSQPTAVLPHLYRNIVWMLAGEAWLGVDSLAVVAVADSASLNVKLRPPALVEQFAFVRERRVARPVAFHSRLAREVLCDPFDLLIGKTPGYPPHKGSCAGIATSTQP